MDIHIRFWNTEMQHVVTKYFGLEFIGHANAEE